MRLTAAVLIALVLTGCRAGRWVWQEEAVTECRGGRVTNERRVTDITVDGRTRNAVVRTDACLD